MVKEPSAFEYLIFPESISPIIVGDTTGRLTVIMMAEAVISIHLFFIAALITFCTWWWYCSMGFNS